MTEETPTESTSLATETPAADPVEETKVEEKTTETPTKGPEDSKADDGKEEGAPEEYEAFKLPDEVQLDEALMGQFMPLAKELNLSQEGAQKLIDLQVEASKQMAESQAAAFGKLRDEWVETSKNDPEFGGAKLDESLSKIKTALDTFGNDALRETLEFTGTGDHPEILRFLYKVGEVVSEGKMHIGTTASKPNAANLLSEIYDKSDHK